MHTCIFTVLVVLSFSLASCGSSGTAAKSASPGFTRTPYLIFSGNNTEMKVLWRGEGPATVSWSTNESLPAEATASAEAPAGEGICTMRGLVPGRKYYYRVRLPEQTAAGSFTAAPPVDAPTKLLVYGDTRSAPAKHDAVAASMAAAYRSDPRLQSIVLHSGDLVSDGKKPSAWAKEFFTDDYPNLTRLRAEVPLQAAVGNHEAKGALFSSLFPYPFVKSRYWSFDYGAVHVALLDQYAAGEGVVDAEQLAWLEADLAASGRPWNIILLHEGGWSAGHHGNNGDVQEKIQPLARKYRAVVVGGHNHYYARAMVEGVPHVTAGGGGAPLYAPDPAHPNVVAAEKSRHFCTIEATQNSLLFRVLRLDGSLIDSFLLSKQAGGG